MKKKEFFIIVLVALGLIILMNILPNDYQTGMGVVIVGTLILSPAVLIVLWGIEFFRRNKK